MSAPESTAPATTTTTTITTTTVATAAASGYDSDDAPLSSVKARLAESNAKGANVSNGKPEIKQEKDEDDDDVPLSQLKKKASTTPSTTPSKPATTPSKPATTSIKENGNSKPASQAKKEQVPVKKETPAKAPTSKDSATAAATKPIKKEEGASKKADAPAVKVVVKKRKIDDSSDSESSSDEDVKKKKKKVAKETPKKEVKKESEVKKEIKKEGPSSDKKKGKKEASSDEDVKDKKKGKKKVKEEPVVWEWWKEEKALPKGKKWRTLSHNGVAFPPEYVPHGVKFVYDGKPVDLSPVAEEVATFYAKYLETDHAKKDAFNKNFWSDFRQYLDSDQRKVIKDFSKANFRPIHEHITAESARKKEDAELKAANKAAKAKLAEQYGKAIIDGHEVKIGNFMVEPPGLFLGRGQHPKTGTVKTRVQPEDVTINIGKDAKVPPAPAGHRWKEVIHDDSVAWMACWKENVCGQPKYVKLHASSHINGQSDMNKFELSRKLKDKIGKIRKAYIKDMQSSDRPDRQRAVAIYFIDKLALRVGNEKGEDEADTVGCCSLRVEHVFLLGDDKVRLCFLGKDSMRYDNEFDVLPEVYKALTGFMNVKDGDKKKKKPDDLLFDTLNPTLLNKYLKEQVAGLSAKVFRTYNASITLERELAKMPESLMDATVSEKVAFYNKCNKEVAILCNHKKTVAKTFAESMGKIEAKVAQFKKQKKRLKQQLLYLKGKGPKPESDSEEEEEVKTPKKEKKDDGKARKKEKEGEKDKGKKRKKDDDDDDDENDFETPKKKKRALPDDKDKVKKAMEKVEQSIIKWETMKADREENKEVALGTSKINYMDPRITAAWCKKVGLPIEKIFSKTLQAKFPWAMDPGEDWKY